jgi:hypothetical protein
VTVMILDMSSTAVLRLGRRSRRNWIGSHSTTKVAVCGCGDTFLLILQVFSSCFETVRLIAAIDSIWVGSTSNSLRKREVSQENASPSTVESWWILDCGSTNISLSILVEEEAQ